MALKEAGIEYKKGLNQGYYLWRHFPHAINMLQLAKKRLMRVFLSRRGPFLPTTQRARCVGHAR